ncbi:DegT/DnrJ/EryC1/StrS family aminotransferase [Devosia sp. LjRoot3]|uniref:DegT/DnrJ/EryC1/StrS family aminotransferase n=1 Tax=Devosia sp. LjRoot3 TaxID=3342319 RepID=UPI003F4FC0DB
MFREPVDVSCEKLNLSDKLSDIYVTKPALPPLEELIPYLEGIWDRGILTNQGPLHREFEARLAAYLGVEHVCLFSSGMAALVTAVQSLELSGEVITTPYSFVATSNAIVWNGLTPVFVDVEPGTLNIDPALIEAAITPRTTAVLPVHCYGNPCAADRIEAIAAKHGLKVLYDAAHAFGVRDAGGSVLRHGDLSVLSFHATKVFNTFEGGAIICASAEAKARIEQLRNFGLVSEVEVQSPGLNGKMNEFSAAMGLVQLGHVDHAIVARQAVDQRYRSEFAQIEGIECIAWAAPRMNYSYFPILVHEVFPLSRDQLQARLVGAGIYTRRYFHPLLSDFAPYASLPSSAGEMPIARNASERVLCLPIYPDLASGDVERIIAAVKGAASP